MIIIYHNTCHIVERIALGNAFVDFFLIHYTKLDDEDSQSSDEEGAPKKSKVYVPPKVAAVPYGKSGNLVEFHHVS